MTYFNVTHISLVLRTCLKLNRGFVTHASIKHSFNINFQRLFGYVPICSRLIHTSKSNGQTQKDGITLLPSPQEVTLILRKNEFNKEFASGSVKSYDSNQLASNDPIEDTRCEGQCKLTPGLLMGVFDGHGGPACAQVVSKRLLDYVAAAMLPTDTINAILKEPQGALVDTYNDKIELINDLKTIYDNSFKEFLLELARTPRDDSNVYTAMEKGVLQLDSDLSREVIEPFYSNGVINQKTLSVALSGAVVCISYIDGPHLYVANIGDCNAVLGTLTDDNEWIAKKITKEHNSENFDELKRIWNEHPDEERKTVIRRDRLLGELAPLRSMGDYRYKWSTELLTKVAVPCVGDKAIPANYHTPPYLTAKPDIFYHRLSPKDKFLIIASDGLWDMLTPLQAVKLVGEHMKGKVFYNPLKLPKKNIQLGDINELLLHRKESLKSKPKDRNAATHLIRHAIGGTEYGIDHSRLAHLLSLTPDVSRMFRDDITVTIAYFDSEFLRQCPA
ncbi:[Pyruvate dehydrogenase [acetyl-transferring]]-phosphatase 1, mitochondrial [Papilio xuthus]|uniref:[Pyruvate dehydrogenase [acetyl-transferring]]-phosphatase 1, mitochondrial n=1 Tax=Papilio xuthus TaxID=66420 RepID=A0A0N1PFM7_PAPXU|nr:[Pyruvate dehydrogenase [acetyl-transferring]]-phosphatase 1, mitochondrial [Papilio xuthus]